MNTPRYLYHATFGPYLASVLRWGLGGAPSMPSPNWEDSEPGVVYLAASLEVARSYAEATDAVPEDWLDHIVVLEVDARLLQPEQLMADPNVRDDAPGQTFVYRGIIQDQALRLVEGASNPM